MNCTSGNSRLDDCLGDHNRDHALLEGDDVRVLAEDSVTKVLVFDPQRLWFRARGIIKPDGPGVSCCRCRLFRYQR